MKKFKDKKVVRKQVGGDFIRYMKDFPVANIPYMGDFPVTNRRFASPGSKYGSGSGFGIAKANIDRFSKDAEKGSSAAIPTETTPAPATQPKVDNVVASILKTAALATPSPEKNAMDQYKKQSPPFMQNLSAFLEKAAQAPDAPPSRVETSLSSSFKKAAKAPDAPPELAKAAVEIPKTKSGMKKFMDEYGKFIALGAMAGTGGKAGRIAAPILAALPGIIGMIKKKKSSGGETPKESEGGAIRKFSGGITKRMMPKLLEKLESMGDNSRAEMIRQYMPNLPQKKGSLKSTIPDIKVIGGDSEENQYSKGGAIRKFKGGSMNMMKDNLTPKYKKGGDMPKDMPKGKMGKAAGEMPQHKKMAMGKPTPQSMGQKFAKGGAAKYAGGGMCKGYGISKKVRPTGPMN